MSTETMYGRKKTATRRRKNLIINPAFQLKYALTIMVGAFIASSLMGIVLYGMLYNQARNRALHLVPTNVLENTYSIILFAAAFSLLMAVALGIWSLVMTHRIGGPLHVLQMQLDQLAQGHLPKPRKLRKNDEFKELFSTFKQFVNAHKSRKQKQLQDIDRALESLGAVNNQSAPLLQLRRQLHDMRDELARSLGQTDRVSTPPDQRDNHGAHDRTLQPVETA